MPSTAQILREFARQDRLGQATDLQTVLEVNATAEEAGGDGSFLVGF